MQYFQCSRCNFKVPANRRTCQTCGYEAPKVMSTVSDTDTKSASKKGSVWARVLGYGQDNKGTESGAHEKPALG